MENKLAITIVALMVLALAAPAVMGANDATYLATVKTSQSTSVVAGSGGVDFGNMLQGTSKTLPTSLVLTNSGGWDAEVSAGFTTNYSGTYGMVNGTNVLAGTSFELGTPGNLMQLNSGATPVDLLTANNVPATGSANYDAKLTVASEEAVAYSGLVQLTFANV